MTLYHTTNRNNIKSIFRDGLDPNMAQGKLKTVWLHTKSRTDWATRHLACIHEIPKSALVTIKVHIPRAWLIRRRRGVWTCNQPIPWERIEIS